MSAPMNLAAELPRGCDFWHGANSLGVLVEGVFQSSHTVSGKRALLELCDKAALVVMAWHGQYRTDIFQVPKARWESEYRVGQK